MRDIKNAKTKPRPTGLWGILHGVDRIRPHSGRRGAEVAQKKTKAARAASAFRKEIKAPDQAASLRMSLRDLASSAPPRASSPAAAAGGSGIVCGLGSVRSSMAMSL